MKKCSRCKLSKDISEFHKSRNSKDGAHNQCKLCARLSKRESYPRRQETILSYVADWYRANKDKKRDYDAKRRATKRHLYRAASKRWRDEHPGDKNADTQTRRAKLRGAMPKWANRFFINEIYDLAARRTAATGIKWVVDHDIPLQGRLVSGLHVETNLRVIPEIVNRVKHNHYAVQ